MSSATSVSYTHLDVYKRQGISSAYGEQPHLKKNSKDLKQLFHIYSLWPALSEKADRRRFFFHWMKPTAGYMTTASHKIGANRQ